MVAGCPALGGNTCKSKAGCFFSADLLCYSSASSSKLSLLAMARSSSAFAVLYTAASFASSCGHEFSWPSPWLDKLLVLGPVSCSSFGCTRDIEFNLHGEASISMHGTAFVDLVVEKFLALDSGFGFAFASATSRLFVFLVS